MPDFAIRSPAKIHYFPVLTSSFPAESIWPPSRGYTGKNSERLRLPNSFSLYTPCVSHIIIRSRVIKALIKISSELLGRRQGTILSAAAVIMTTVLLSRLLGFVRLRLLYSYFVTDEVGVYLAAFRLPDMLFELLVTGSLATAFIPVFTNYLVKKDQTEAFHVAAYVINVGLLLSVLVLIPMLLFTRQISYLLVPGFNESQRTLMVSFTRIMLIGQLIPLIIGNFVTGMLQSFERFILPALAPVIYNIGIIAGILVLTPIYGLYGVVWGVVIGGILFVLIQIPLLVHLGYRHQWKVDLTHPGVRKIGKLMLPRILGLAVTQIDTTADLFLASLLGARFISIFYSAQSLQLFPIGLFGATFAQAALPALSVTSSEKDLIEFKKLFLATMHQILFFVLPASVMLIVLRVPIVRLIYGAAKFDWPATVYTGQTLSLFAISIFAQALVQLFARGFYALHDTKTPVLVGVVSVLFNTLLSILFISYFHLPVWSLAFSTSLASLINWFALLMFLHKKVGGFDIKALGVPFIKMVVSSMTTGIFLYVPMKLLDQLVFDTTRAFDLLLLTLVATISGLSMYIFLAWFLDIEEVGTFFRLLQKVKRVPRVFFASNEFINGERPPVS